MSSPDALEPRSLSHFELKEHAGRKGAALAAFKAMELTLRALCDYHRHEVVGFEHFPRTGPALLAFNHSLATYDGFMVAVPAFDKAQRLLWGVADRLIFRIPGLGGFFRSVGFSEGTRAGSVALLERGELLALAPGGMREALGLRRKKYTVDWEGRTGFVRVSVLSGAPVVLAACPRADDIFTVYDNSATDWAYRKYRLPAPVFRGVGPTLVPRPIKLTHLLSEPIAPPPGRELATEDTIREHCVYLERRMNALMKDALDLGG